MGSVCTYDEITSLFWAHVVDGAETEDARKLKGLVIEQWTCGNRTVVCSGDLPPVHVVETEASGITKTEAPLDSPTIRTAALVVEETAGAVTQASETEEVPKVVVLAAVLEAMLIAVTSAGAVTRTRAASVGVGVAASPATRTEVTTRALAASTPQRILWEPMTTTVPRTLQSPRSELAACV